MSAKELERHAMLQPDIVVCIQSLCSRHIVRYCILRTEEVKHQLTRSQNANAAEVVANGRHRKAFFQLAPWNRDGFCRRNHHHVERRRKKDDDVWKDGMHGREHYLQRWFRKFVELYPLAEDPIRRKAPSDALIEVHGKKIRNAGDPWIRGL